jgi:Protein of unknown function (DUF1493)
MLSPTKEFDFFSIIIDFVSRTQGVRPDILNAQTRLEEDLGITGDDALIFIENFSHEFSVDIKDFNFERHFAPDAWNPIWAFFTPHWLKDRAREPVTIGHLMQVVADKRWSEPKSQAEKG